MRFAQLINRVLKLHDLPFALHHRVLHLLSLPDQRFLESRVGLVAGLYLVIFVLHQQSLVLHCY